MSDTADFLLELRSEEIPARMQDRAREDLAKLFAAEMAKAGIATGRITTYATPRRLALIAHDLPTATAGSREEVKGPRASAPPQALEGFLRKTGLSREALVERDGVLFAVLDKPGRRTAEVLATAIPAIVRGFPWPKSMRWGAASSSTESARWVRPLQGIVALLGDDVIECDVAGVASGAATVGHRFHHPGIITIGSARDYVEKLRACHVVVDQDERRAIIALGAKLAAQKAGLVLVEDQGLLIENAGLTEWPMPLLGRFDAEYLSVPPEVIQLTARVNQKYFVCRDADGALANAFVCTANIDAADGGAKIVEGNRKVLAARLSDAKFFYETDLRTRLEDLRPKLEKIVFHEKLGTVADKVERVAKLARWLVEEGIVGGAAGVRYGGAGDASGHGLGAADTDQAGADGARTDDRSPQDRTPEQAEREAGVDRAALDDSRANTLSAHDRTPAQAGVQPGTNGAARSASEPATAQLDPGLRRGAAGGGRAAGDVDADRAALAEMAERAARLAKADLVTGMVGEFPELQGLMGGYYARAQGEPDAVADAVRDHYKPVGQGDDVPTAPVTVAVSLADKLDTIAKFFEIKQGPTGSRDPFALRRAAFAVLALLEKNQLRFDISAILAGIVNFIGPNEEMLAITIKRFWAQSWAEIVDGFGWNEQRGQPYPEPLESTPETIADLRRFFADRLKVQQREAGVRHDLIDAVFALGGEDDLVRLLARVKALQAFVTTDDGANLLAGYKRAANILKKEGWLDGAAVGTSDAAAAGASLAGEEDPLAGVDDPDMAAVVAAQISERRHGYTPEPAEAALRSALDAAEPRADAAVAAEDFEGAMAALASLRAPIDSFFDDVTVNDSDPVKRAARLDLLARVRAAVHRVADFSRIEG